MRKLLLGLLLLPLLLFAASEEHDNIDLTDGYGVGDLVTAPTPPGDPPPGPGRLMKKHL